MLTATEPGVISALIEAGDLAGVPGLAVFDIDGVLADGRHRDHHAQVWDWDAYFGAMDQDGVHPEGRYAYEQFGRLGWRRGYLTGRREDTRGVTRTWLGQNGYDPTETLLMRPFADRRLLAMLKASVLRTIVQYWAPLPVVLLDDDPHVIDAASRVSGVIPIHCTWYVKKDTLVWRGKS
jgi:hypothetical protein